jgi:uncharacterized protein (DUF1015 family)
LRDAQPAVYLHEYSDSGLTVRGLVGCLDVSHRASSLEDCQIFPHEGVHPQQVDELASRMDEMSLNPAPILLVHRGPAEIRELSRRVRSSIPGRQYVDHAGQEHRVWSITDREQQESVEAALADARLLVADRGWPSAQFTCLDSLWAKESGWRWNADNASSDARSIASANWSSHSFLR